VSNNDYEAFCTEEQLTLEFSRSEEKTLKRSNLISLNIKYKIKKTTKEAMFFCCH
jgi:hypothetical protein